MFCVRHTDKPLGTFPDGQMILSITEASGLSRRQHCVGAVRLLCASPFGGVAVRQRPGEFHAWQRVEVTLFYVAGSTTARSLCPPRAGRNRFAPTRQEGRAEGSLGEQRNLTVSCTFHARPSANSESATGCSA